MTYKEFKKKYNICLNDQQEAAVKQVEGPSLILAVPGSGKTTVLVSRLGYMIYGLGIKPESILTVTYTVAATYDMKRRFEKFFGDKDSSRVEFRTINGISQKVLTFYGISTGKKPYAVADKETGTIIRDVFLKINGQYPTDNDISTIATAIGYVKNMCLKPDEIRAYKVDTENFFDIYTAYNNELKKRKLIDYDDQMVYALKILKAFPAVLKYFQDTYQYFCMDEAQDTSKIQHEIMALLAGKTKNLFMVGDEDQSIYGFRAAYPKALMNFSKDYEGAKTFLLETNYRSGKEIVEAATLTIKRNKNRVKKKMVAAREDQGKVSRLDTSMRKNQYKYLAEVCENCKCQTAILYRNNESALPLIDILERHGVPYRLKNADIAFFSHPLVNDLRDFVALAKNPCDYDAFLRIYYKMNVGISKIQAQGAAYNCSSQGMLLYIAGLETTKSGVKKRLLDLSRDFKGMLKLDAATALDKIIDDMGYGKYMENRSMDKSKLDILRLLSLQVKNIEELFERLDLLKDLLSEGIDTSDSKVILSTIHSAKGLEFERVYMMDMVEGVIPSAKKPGRYANEAEVEAFEEERRLYYVAMTRAKEELYIFTFDYDTTSIFSRELFGMEKAKAAFNPQPKSYKAKGPKLSTNYGKARPKSDYES